jgi:hypothetical protein
MWGHRHHKDERVLTPGFQEIRNRGPQATNAAMFSIHRILDLNDWENVRFDAQEDFELFLYILSKTIRSNAVTMIIGTSNWPVIDPKIPAELLALVCMSYLRRDFLFFSYT